MIQTKKHTAPRLQPLMKIVLSEEYSSILNKPFITTNFYPDLLDLINLPNYHIINTHHNTAVATAFMVAYIQSRLAITRGYALSLVQSPLQGEIQTEYLEYTIHGLPTPERRVACHSVANKENFDWEKVLQPSTLVFLTPRQLFLLSLTPDWINKYGLPSIIFVNGYNSFSISTISLLYPFVRVLMWKDNGIQIIFNAYISNPEEMATRFFGKDGRYILVR
ncbi:MAG: hypothetical protein ACXADY_10605 [Candidatus Hodarchaeales archaeon]|jgi:hypothetical protein